MASHWQRKPLLVRAAFPDFRSPIAPQRLFEIASDEDDGAESRLIRRHRGRWSLDHGPFEPGLLPLKARRDWTLLVQGMDLHDDSIRAILDRFRFIADARLDDLMISYAVDGGGVGPHLDSYDVFLVQAHGKRHWRYGLQRNTKLLDGEPLKLLQDFRPQYEAVLEPGDMLYLPPGWAHDGMAIGECMTFSVGFRAPSRHELIAAWLADCADEPPQGLNPRFADPGTRPTRRPGQIPDTMAATLGDWIHQWKPDKASVDQFIGRFLTEPKPSVWFDPPARALATRAFADRVHRDGLIADRRSRMAYRGRYLFINGECIEVPASDKTILQRFADLRNLPPDAMRAASLTPTLLQTLQQWFDAGWIHFGPKAVSGRSGPLDKKP